MCWMNGAFLTRSVILTVMSRNAIASYSRQEPHFLHADFAKARPRFRLRTTAARYALWFTTMGSTTMSPQVYSGPQFGFPLPCCGHCAPVASAALSTRMQWIIVPTILTAQGSLVALICLSVVFQQRTVVYATRYLEIAEGNLFSSHLHSVDFFDNSKSNSKSNFCTCY